MNVKLVSIFSVGFKVTLWFTHYDSRRKGFLKIAAVVFCDLNTRQQYRFLEVKKKKKKKRKKERHEWSTKSIFFLLRSIITLRNRDIHGKYSSNQALEGDDEKKFESVGGAHASCPTNLRTKSDASDPGNNTRSGIVQMNGNAAPKWGVLSQK